ncbi:hypothetical protein K9U39_11560 [Rhodoblastus acidophilus]|uniref:Uncharacterized protein n=1 Tax=Candidatus Rhodoblastus alkanivorans TaxID=2954117 RepID=A0ABS9Z9C2_9HYPH|nr:hypothetical protein [Candidatus Rhodoblastus alkanivorans]MCI4680010.1 hypothetical protein [Candidatus Rhodoblastus alkanivorans]MCI4684248.1 hypothetical protein [Candidatus Rhodoblastus alkanivorans]MDI4641568.1 hypothetical protein [Rhodoblastus acidophilus]
MLKQSLAAAVLAASLATPSAPAEAYWVYVRPHHHYYHRHYYYHPHRYYHRHYYHRYYHHPHYYHRRRWHYY